MGINIGGGTSGGMYVDSGIRSDVNAVKSDLSERGVNLRQPPFNLKGDGSDETAALQSVRDYLAGLSGVKPVLVIPSGTYTYSSSPNWGIPNLRIITLGDVIFNYTGTDKAFICDASADSVRRFYENISIGKLTIQGNASTLHGFYLRNIVRSLFSEIEVREMNTASGKAFSLWGSISNTFIMPVSSVNRHNTANMAYDGFFVTNTDVGGDKSTNNTIVSPILEGLKIGMRLFVADNTNVFGGTCESNTLYGVVTSANARVNKFVGTACENNGTADIADAGKMNSFDNCYTQKNLAIQPGSVGSKVTGGFHQTITIDAAAIKPVIDNLYVSQFTTGGTVITNNNQTARITNVLNMQDGSEVYGQYAMNPFKARTNITVGASPFKYTNTSQFPQHVNVYGGTVTQLLWGYGTDSYVIGGGSSKGPVNGQVLLMPGDSLTVSYSAAPQMNYIPR